MKTGKINLGKMQQDEGGTRQGRGATSTGLFTKPYTGGGCWKRLVLGRGHLIVAAGGFWRPVDVRKGQWRLLEACTGAHRHLLSSKLGSGRKQVIYIVSYWDECGPGELFPTGPGRKQDSPA